MTEQPKRYECDQCGECCRRLIIEIDVMDLVREPRLIAVSKPLKIPPHMILVDDHDGEPIAEPIPGYGGGAMLACLQPCKMLGPGNACQVYATRPTCCLMFLAGSVKCQELRVSAGLPELQPTRLIPLSMFLVQS